MLTREGSIFKGIGQGKDHLKRLVSSGTSGELQTGSRLTCLQLKLGCWVEQMGMEYSLVHFPLEQHVLGKVQHYSPPDCAQAKEQSGLQPLHCLPSELIQGCWGESRCREEVWRMRKEASRQMSACIQLLFNLSYQYSKQPNQNHSNNQPLPNLTHQSNRLSLAHFSLLSFLFPTSSIHQPVSYRRRHQNLWCGYKEGFKYIKWDQVQFDSHMNKTATTISQGCLKELYTQQPTKTNSLLLQIIAFQTSEANPKEIILRISDREAFVDCLLVGPYRIDNSRIVSTEYNQLNQVFQRYDLVRVADYFCKIDPSKICQLRIIVRKLEDPVHLGEILGRPEEVSQFIENANIKGKTVFDGQRLNNFGTEDTPIKIEELAPEPNYFQPENQDKSNKAGTTAGKTQKQDESLTLVDIMNNKQGYFVGRLVRMKFGSKDAKDGPMSFLYLGLLDTNGQLVRINIAGRTAIKQSKQLRKGRCYLIRGLQLFHGQKSKLGPQIRLKDKEYKIYEIQNEAVKSQYKHEYYRWQHDSEWADSDLVDVVGVIEDIEEKITYRNTSTFQEQRDVVRLLVKNSFKTVKISFWADHIHILQSMQLHRKQAILLEDIKKKKTFFLDYISESNIILLDDDPQLKERFADFMPPVEECPEPTCVRQLLQVFAKEPYSSKTRIIPAKILSINPKWVIYKMCNGCKKKMEKILESCLECHQSDFVYKYNCAIEIYDSTASTNCIAFDAPCEKLFARSANDFSLLSEAQTKELCDAQANLEFTVSLQLKNNRQIIRVLQPILPEPQNQVPAQVTGIKLDPSPITKFSPSPFVKLDMPTGIKTDPYNPQ